MRDKIKEFLLRLNYLFPIEGKRFEPVCETYTDILLEKCLKREYDLKKLTSIIAQEWKLTKFPPVKFIIEQLPYAEVHHYSDIPANNGGLLVLTLPNGYTYKFTISSFGKPLEEVKKIYKKRYGECEIKFYPEGTTIIVDKIFNKEE